MEIEIGSADTYYKKTIHYSPNFSVIVYFKNDQPTDVEVLHNGTTEVSVKVSNKNIVEAIKALKDLDILDKLLK